MKPKNANLELVSQESDGVLTIRSSRPRIRKILGASLMLSIPFAILVFFVPFLRGMALIVSLLLPAIWAVSRHGGVMTLIYADYTISGALQHFLLRSAFYTYIPLSIYAFFLLNQNPLIAAFLWIPIPILFYLFLGTNISFTKTSDSIEARPRFFNEELTLKLEDIRNVDEASLSESSYFTINGLEISGPFLSDDDKSYMDEKLKAFIEIPIPNLEYETTFEHQFEKPAEKVKAEVSYKNIDEA